MGVPAHAGRARRQPVGHGLQRHEDLAVRRTLALDGGQVATAEVIAAGLDPLIKIREAFGGRMEVTIEMRSRWMVPAAKRILRALEAFEQLWVEDPVRNDDITSLASVRAATTIPIAAGENIGARNRHRELIEQKAVDIVLTDVTWNGGVTESRRRRRGPAAVRSARLHGTSRTCRRRASIGLCGERLPAGSRARLLLGLVPGCRLGTADHG